MKTDEDAYGRITENVYALSGYYDEAGYSYAKAPENDDVIIIRSEGNV